MSEFRFVYHYHAEYHGPDVVTRIDGIAQMLKPIRSMEDYHILKSVVVRGLTPGVPVDQLIITSLTPLGETNDSATGAI
jgi:hypothetical protein